ARRRARHRGAWYRVPGVVVDGSGRPGVSAAVRTAARDQAVPARQHDQWAWVGDATAVCTVDEVLPGGSCRRAALGEAAAVSGAGGRAGGGDRARDRASRGDELRVPPRVLRRRRAGVSWVRAGRAV